VEVADLLPIIIDLFILQNSSQMKTEEKKEVATKIFNHLFKLLLSQYSTGETNADQSNYRCPTL